MIIFEENEMSRTYYADSLGFLAPQREPPIFNSDKRPKLSLVHTTSVAPTVLNFEEAIREHATFVQHALRNQNVHAILTARDVERTDRSLGIMFGLQHAPEGLTRTRVEQLAANGVRAMTLAYNEGSPYAGGCNVQGGVTGLGKDVLSWMAEFGIIADVTHLNDESTADVLDAVQRCPRLHVMASHSGVKEVYPHSRNLSTANLQWIRDMNGYVGIPAFNPTLVAEGGDSFTAFVRHVLFVVGSDGRSNVGIGSDNIYVNRSIEEARANFDRMVALLGDKVPAGLYFPEYHPDLIGLGSNTAEILELEMRTTFDPCTVRGLRGDNFREFLQFALPQN